MTRREILAAIQAGIGVAVHAWEVWREEYGGFRAHTSIVGGPTRSLGSIAMTVPTCESLLAVAVGASWRQGEDQIVAYFGAAPRPESMGGDTVVAGFTTADGETPSAIQAKADALVKRVLSWIERTIGRPPAGGS